MTQTSRTQLTVLINIFWLALFSAAVFLIGNVWQQQSEYESKERDKQRYFTQVEHHFNDVASFLSSLSNQYSVYCPANFVLNMRKALFNMPGAIEFSVVQTVGDHGVVVCNSWDDKDRMEASLPMAHAGLIIVGPHAINLLDTPVYTIKKTTEYYEFNVIIKQSNLEDFLHHRLGMVLNDGPYSANGNVLSSMVTTDLYRPSNVISNLTYSNAPYSEDTINDFYFVPIVLILFILAHFLVTPKWVRAIDKVLLRRKIENHYYYNEYQPVVDTRNGGVFSIEVFLRSKDDDNARDTIEKMKRLDLSIDHTIFQISQIERSFSTEFIREHDFQVNISSRHLKSVFFVEHILALEGLRGTSLILEVTEDENLMLHKNIIKKHMNVLKEKGCRFAIDDFGMEYSGLSYISEFDFDIVKTDKIFMGNTEQNNAILKSVVAFCHELNIDCIAEGIETQDDNEKTIQIGIYLHQGWYHGRPMSANNVIAFTLKEGTPNAQGQCALSINAV